MSYTKILISGTIEVRTGLHIGGDSSFSAIGAIDMPVVRDPLSRQPVIPGSSLKGKMRSLLAREKGSERAKKTDGFEKDSDEIKRLFGSSSDTSNADKTGMQMSRLQFSDCFLINKDKLSQMTEIKFENTIDRMTAVANPRQIERVVRGAEFGLEIIYNVENEKEIDEDFANISTALILLQNDYLGGGGTRGNGRVLFKNLDTKRVTGDFDEKMIPEIILD